MSTANTTDLPATAAETDSPANSDVNATNGPAPALQRPDAVGEPAGTIPAWLDEPPRSVPAPVPVTAPMRLPFEQLTSENFERLILALARQTFTVEHAQQYGVRGQKQHGVDLYGRLASPADAQRRYVTIQCRNVVDVTPAAMKAAVDEFLAGEWAQRTATFVFATRASVVRTQLIEAVEAIAERIRGEHIRFEVWDGERLSERLRYKHDLVALFFGQATAELFCGTETPVVPSRPDGPGARRVPTRSRRHGARAADGSHDGERPGTDVTPDEPSSPPARWLPTRPGVRTIRLSNGPKEIMGPHRGTHYVGADAPPSVRVGVSIPCGPLPASAPRTSQVRRRFVDLLRRPPIADLVAALVSIADPKAWHSYGDNGRASYAAILSEPDPIEPPSAWARLQLPTPDLPAHGRDPRCADFILHVDWPSSTGAVTGPPFDLRQWRHLMERVLALPSAVTGCLVDELSISLGDDPELAIGLWLATQTDLTQIVNIDGLSRVSGSQVSRWFDAYAFADQHGQEPGTVAVAWITDMCDDVLHLDGYEDLL